MANIRNQDSWIHSDTPEKATEKAKDLVRMAVARSARLYPLHEKNHSPLTNGLWLWEGVLPGMNAGLGLADQGFEVVLVEKRGPIGGNGQSADPNH